MYLKIKSQFSRETLYRFLQICNTNEGLVCNNFDQTHGYACLDYKVRFLCGEDCNPDSPVNGNRRENSIHVFDSFFETFK